MTGSANHKPDSATAGQIVEKRKNFYYSTAALIPTRLSPNLSYPNENIIERNSKDSTGPLSQWLAKNGTAFFLDSAWSLLSALHNNQLACTADASVLE